MIKKTLTLILVLTSGVINAQTSIDDSNEPISIKEDYRYYGDTPLPRTWLKLSQQSNFTDEDIKSLIGAVETLAAEEAKLPEDWWGRIGNSNTLIYPWYEVYDCMTKYKDWVIGKSRVRCSHCCEKTLVIYYISPDYTWRNLYGRAGFFRICPHCHRQIEFITMVMN